MRRSNWLVLAMIAIGFTAGMRVARASDVQGVLARPIRVLLDPPPPALAAGVQIQGIAAIASNDGCYTVPSCGYLDYTCKAGEESLCREQWNEIAAAAAAGRCVTFGARRDATGAMANNGRVRPFSEAPGTPDVYIASQGLGVAVSDCPPLLGCSVDLSAACVPPAGGTGGAGSGTGGVTGTGGAGAGGAVGTGGAAGTGGAVGTGGTPGTGGKAGGTGGAAATADAAAERPQLAAKQGCSLAAGAAGGGGSLAVVAGAILLAAARRGRRGARAKVAAEVGRRSRR